MTKIHIVQVMFYPMVVQYVALKFLMITERLNEEKKMEAFRLEKTTENILAARITNCSILDKIKPDCSVK